uniref:Uncharacterized protein n=1 Tax=Setaria digitata TaxID=48799 RepID=A0A915Q481_9BILA
MDLHGREFERTGGKQEWLEGLSYASKKIQNLDVLNKVLAHQPWSVNVDHLTTLTKCSSPPNWTLSELVQASVILAQTHVLCSFVLGNGSIHPNNCTDYEIELILERMNQLKKAKINANIQQSNEIQMQKDFLEVQNDYSDKTSETSGREEVLLSEGRSKNCCVEESVQKCRHRASLFTCDICFGYIDFVQHAQAGFARTHKIHVSIRHDDYNYAEVNAMLSREVKTFIKTTCCNPHQMTDSLRQSVLVDFKSSEKVHVLLLLMEARLQAELIYFFRALVKLNNSSITA